MIRTRLGGSAPVTDPFPKKPKGMRCKTYNRLKAKADGLEMKWDPRGLFRTLKEVLPGLDPSVYAILIDPDGLDEIREILESSIRKSTSKARK
jgi:hypothetical protein